MEKILVVSDSHGRTDLLSAVINKEAPFSTLIHCGDGVTDIYRVEVPAGVRILKVMGNVDADIGLDMERCITDTLCGDKILIVHGDMHGVKRSCGDTVVKAAELAGAKRVFFGHTHVPEFKNGRYPVLFNPGALKDGSYGVIEISGGRWQYSLRQMEMILKSSEAERNA